MDRALVAEKLKNYRAGRPQREIAEKVGISQSTYAMYETGERMPSDEIKVKLARLYNKTVQEIFFA